MDHFTLSTETFSKLFALDRAGGNGSKNLRRHYAVVPVGQIPEDWASWLDVNARDSSDRGKVPTAIRQTLNEKPDWFATYNRGLTIVASMVDYNNKNKTVTLGFNDRRYHGVLDGGHTLRAILDERLEDEPQQGFCNLEIFTGLDETEIPSVVEARNTSKQVETKSLLDLSGAFGPLKDAIGKEKSDLIIWHENAPGQLDVRELIGILTALDPSTITENTQPTRAYSGKEACLRRFKQNTAAYEKLYRIAPDALDMWDAIQYWLPETYNEIGPSPGKRGRFGGLDGVKRSPERPKELSFIRKTTELYIPTGYIYPVLSAFRAMLVEKDGRWVWRDNIRPLEMIENGVAAEIFRGSIRHSANYGNPNRVGKDPQVWISAYLVAQNKLQAALIENLLHSA